MSTVTRHTTVAFLLVAAACAGGGANVDTATAKPTANAAAAVPPPAPAPTYTKDLPDSLTHQATVTESLAAVTALARVPTGTIVGVELEREGGKLLYSYDIKVPGKSGIDEVQIDAMTGQTVGGIAHEGAADAAQESAAESKESRQKKPGTKKPPAE